MAEQVTIVVVPRDRFSSVVECVQSILQYTEIPLRLAILDFGYPAKVLGRVKQVVGGRVPLEVVACGRTIPMVAFRDYVAKIQTPYTAWVDNDTFVTERWISALLARAAAGARVILPVTLECEGLDVDKRRLPLRNHVSHTELRKVTVGGKEYVFDHKPFRRAAPEDLPKEAQVVDFFELHTFFAETKVLKQLDLPPMVVREHIDIGIQLRKMGIDIWNEPQAVVHFDNMQHRPSLADLRFFFYRWDEKKIDESHRLFRERWGYDFYNEQFMRNWAFRRKVYSVCRYLGLPQKSADLVSRAFNKLLRKPIPNNLRRDPLKESTLALEHTGEQVSAGAYERGVG
jgi:hypothetical protein